ncbi:MBL fold metallo-hydrolase [Kribbella sp. WER1]
MTFPGHWDDGTDPATPDHQVHWYDDRTAIIRQALHTSFEGPFLYLLLGTTHALLVDTGTGEADLPQLVHSLRGDRELIVAHSHGHGDHVGGDSGFDAVVGRSVEQVAAYFGLGNWPHHNGTVDLGERVVDVIPIPGHQGADVTLYDRRTRLLLTGDSLYPGRLYVKDWAAYRASVRRLGEFVAAGNAVEWVLGAHVEMTAEPGKDYPMGADRHPGEHVLQLRPAVLDELVEVLAAAGDEPVRIERDHFIVVPV